MALLVVRLSSSFIVFLPGQRGNGAKRKGAQDRTCNTLFSLPSIRSINQPDQ
jgi:hypothetical protein